MTHNWAELVLDQAWMSRVDQLAFKRFNDATLAEEAATYVIEQLSADDWSRCQQYDGKAKPQTYLHTLTVNLIEEYSRKRFGRPRPPEWLKREGQLWEQLWKKICLERQPVQAVIDHFMAAGKRELEYIQSCIRQIRGRIPNCGIKQRQVSDRVSSDDDQGEVYLLDHYLQQQSPEEQQKQQIYGEFSVLVSQLLLNEPPNPDKDLNAYKQTSENSDLQALVARLQQSLQLTDEEILIVKMAYQDGLKKNVIAKALGLPSHQPGRILKRVMERVSSVFADENLDTETARDYLAYAL